MRGFIQAIAVGSGLVAFGSKLEPQLNVTDPAAMAQFLHSYERREALYGLGDI